jgi:hypothetical protein
MWPAIFTVMLWTSGATGVGLRSGDQRHAMSFTRRLLASIVAASKLLSEQLELGQLKVSSRAAPRKHIFFSVPISWWRLQIGFGLVKYRETEAQRTEGFLRNLERSVGPELRGLASGHETRPIAIHRSFSQYQSLFSSPGYRRTARDLCKKLIAIGTPIDPIARPVFRKLQ